MVAFVLSVLAAAPVVGSTWRMTLDSSGEMVAKTNRRGELHNALPGRAVVDLKVLEVEDAQPKRMSVAVVQTELRAFHDGPYALALNYGEPDFSAKVDASDDKALNLRRMIGTAIRPDPVVTAAEALGDPCSAEASAVIGAAAAKLVNRLTEGEPPLLARDAKATCVKGKPSWMVSFVLIKEGSLDLPIAYTGTVTVPRGAWRSTLELRGKFKWVSESASGRVELSGTTHLSVTFVAR
jgi:hypothetical protein